MNGPTSADIEAVVALFKKLIAAWNGCDARAYASCFEEKGCAVGFDGSQLDGRDAISASLSSIFKDHPTAQYVTLVRDVRLLGSDVAVLRAFAGMVPRNASKIKIETNAIQSLVARRVGVEWAISLFQNTPAAFHGRPEAGAALTEELQKTYDSGGQSK